MKAVIFYFDGCPYCVKAKRAAEELLRENPEYKRAEIEWVNEKREPERAERYDYYYVPSIFIGDRKLYEAHPGDDYELIKGKVKEALDELLGQESA